MVRSPAGARRVILEGRAGIGFRRGWLEVMTGAYADIARLLRAARRRMATLSLAMALGNGLAAGLACLLSGALALAAGARLPFRFVALGGFALVLLGSLARALLDVFRQVGGEEAAARTLAAADPSLRSALQSSVELSREREEIAAVGRFSVALLDAHVERTAARARAFDLSRAIPDRAARQAAGVLLGMLALSLVVLGFGGERLRHAYHRVLLGDPPGSAVETDPITGDIELTYRYPAYMRREPKTLSGTGGEIHAPKGTEVALRTRADRLVSQAEIVVDLEADPSSRPAAPGALKGASTAPPAEERPLPPAASLAPGGAPAVRRYALLVRDGRELSGEFPVLAGGHYRFRFLGAKGKLLAEGPPIPIIVEPDAYPTVQILAPDKDLEVDPSASVEILWQAEDDVGIGEVALVLSPPQGEERRIPLRSGEPVRRDTGSYPLAIAPLGLGEGERLTYRVEAQDTDDVSGPKTSSSDTRTIRIYSESEHRRQMLERARQAYEELVASLGDRLDLRIQGTAAGMAEERLPQAQAVDGRTRAMTEHLRLAARELRKDPAGPREVARALENVAQDVRFAVEGAMGSRTRLAISYRMAREAADGGRRQQAREDLRQIASDVVRDDATVERVEEKGVLYLEQLLDKRRAEDLVRLAKNLSQRRRDLADLMERYRKAPSEGAKEDLLAQVRRMKEQVRDLLSRMAELSKGFNDEHMNEEALAELAKSQDLLGGLDEVEKKLAQGDVEGAMKALDQMAGAMDQMMAGLSRTASLPDERAQALMKEMLAFKARLQKLEQGQKDLAAETEKLRAEYRRKLSERMRQEEEALKHLHELAQSAQRDVEGARPGVTFRAQPDYETAQDALKDLERALGMRELEGANDAVRRAQPPLERLSRYLEEDASTFDSPPLGRERPQVDDAHRRVDRAVPKVREIRDELSRLFPDPRSMMSRNDQDRLGELSRRQGELESEAAQLEAALEELARKAPVFPPSAQGQLGESRGHMGEAASELGNRNPQRGRGEQDLALDALARFRKGLEDAAKSMQQQGSGPQGMGFPFPFAEGGGNERSGDGLDPSREKVKIPGAEEHKVPEAFRKDLLEAMKQGMPERYKPDVEHYYEELVK